MLNVELVNKYNYNTLKVKWLNTTRTCVQYGQHTVNVRYQRQHLQYFLKTYNPAYVNKNTMLFSYLSGGNHHNLFKVVQSHDCGTEDSSTEHAEGSNT